MALETLKNVNKVNGYDVTRGVSNFSKDRPIFIHHEESQLCFKIQDGPIKENGINGCQVDEVIEVAKIIISGLNEKFQCRENSMVITKLDEAIMWLKKRKEDRQMRGVEGTSSV